MRNPSTDSTPLTSPWGPAQTRAKKWEYRYICQEVCPWNVRFAEVAAERDYAARPAWEAEWGRDPDDPDDDGPTEAVIPTTDGPASSTS